MQHQTKTDGGGEAKMMAVRRVALFVDSRDRDETVSPTPANYRLMLPTSYREVSEIHLVGAELPRAAVHAFSAARGNVTLAARIVLSGVPAAPITVTLPTGTYADETAVAAALQAALITAFGTEGGTRELTVSVIWGAAGGPGGVLSITSNLAGEVVQILKGTACASALGFTDAAASQATRPPRLARPPYLLLDLEPTDLSQAHTTNTNSVTRTFAKVPLAGMVTADGEYTIVDRVTLAGNECVLPVPLARLDRITVSWRYPEGGLVDFVSAADHSFTLLVSCRQAV